MKLNGFLHSQYRVPVQYMQESNSNWAWIWFIVLFQVKCLINYAFFKLSLAAPILSLYCKVKKMVAYMVFNPQRKIFCTTTGMTFEACYFVVLPIIMHSKSMILLCKAVVILLKRDMKCYTAWGWHDIDHFT